MFIVDRKKDIIRGGENIACAEVERRFTPARPSPRPAFSEVPRSPSLGEVPVAVIYPHEASGLTDDDLKAFLEPRIAAFKIPAQFIFVDQPLPKLGTGKIDRVAIKAQHRIETRRSPVREARPDRRAAL